MSRLKPLVAVIIGVGVIALALEFLWPDSVNESDSTDEEIAAAIASGAEAGTAVASTPAGTMAREGAVLEIRSRETAIRNAGFTVAADSFAASAYDAMQKAGVFDGK